MKVATREATAICKNKTAKVRVMMDAQYFHLSFMARRRFEELFGTIWEKSAKTEVIIGKDKMVLDKFATIDLKINNKYLKNIFIWLIDDDSLIDIFPPEYKKYNTQIDIILGSIVLQNYNISLREL
ncbi:MAG: hypothetical protein Q6363_003110 [Candidatus Njordarchaeota archaeon]